MFELKHHNIEAKHRCCFGHCTFMRQFGGCMFEQNLAEWPYMNKFFLILKFKIVIDGTLWLL